MYIALVGSQRDDCVQLADNALQHKLHVVQQNESNLSSIKQEMLIWYLFITKLAAIELEL